MEKAEYRFSFEVYESIHELNSEDALLLTEAKNATKFSYAPYSRFRVASAASLCNGKRILGFNQENASFPAGLCAERVLLSSAATLFPGIAIETIAISYLNENGPDSYPISPCGICRQSLQEYEQRQKKPIRLVLGGMNGKVFVIPSAQLLLPLAFSNDAMKPGL